MNCEGCVFCGLNAKRCQTCARQYADRYEEPKKQTPEEKRRAMKAISMLGLMETVIEENNQRYIK